MKLHDNEDVPLVNSDSGKASQSLALVSSVLIVFAIIIGTYYATPLWPAFEQDTRLSWTASTTTLVCTLMTIAEPLGALLVASLSDYYAVGITLAFNASFMCFMDVSEILTRSETVIVTCIFLAVFVKAGILWPAICSFTGARVRGANQDIAFLLCAMGSRSAETVKAFTLGTLMTALRLSWREAVSVLLIGVAAVLLLAFMIFPRDVARRVVDDIGKEPPLNEMASKFVRLLKSFDAWVVFLTAAAVQPFWSMDLYTASLFEDLYAVTPGEAARLNGVGPAGMLLGLIFAFVFSSTFGVKPGRVAHLLQVFVGAVALGLLAIWPHTPSRYTAILIAIGGFGAVVPAYVPALVFSATSLPEERAFRLGVLYCGYVSIYTLFTYLFGRLRELADDAEAWKTGMCGSSAISMALSFLAMMYMYSRSDECSHEDDKKAGS